MTDRLTFSGTTQITGEGRRLKGSVVLAGQRTFRNNEWVEVDPAALVKADATDVFARIDHDPSKVVGRTKNGTLSILRTDQGIEFETGELPNTSYANDALELARGGYFGGSSFEIDGFKSTFSTDPDGTRVRRITSIKRLIDVSPVLDPAFASTASAFSKENNEMPDGITPVEPQAPPAPPVEPPKAQFNDSKDETFETSLAFAKSQSTEALENAMDALITASKGQMSPAARAQYTAFAQEYDERKRVDAQAQARAEQFRIQHQMRTGNFPKAPETTELYASDDYANAFMQYARGKGDRVMEQFAGQTIAGDGSQGGFTVPDGFVAKIVERLKAYGGIAAEATEITTATGESLRWPTIDDTSNKAQLVAEDTAPTTGADLVFGSAELGAFEYDASGASGTPIEVSLPLLQDSTFDIEGLLTRLLGQRIGRKQADHWATGAGGSEPLGLFTGKTADAMSATVSSLAAAEHVLQLDAAYRDSGNCVWIMSDTTLAKLWTAQTTTNAPIFMPGGTINGKPFNSLYGYPVRIDPAAGDLVAFGDIQQAYVIRRVRGVQLLVDPYTPQARRAVRYHAWARADGTVQDPNAYSVSTWASVSADT